MYKNNVTFDHVKLVILDLTDAGHQPMFYNKRDGASSHKFKSKNMNSSHISIVYNGEIYNYLELREELKRRGNTFSTNTHSEVILASHLEYGPNCVKRFNGMWAFCIYDEVKGILFFSRR